MTVKVYELKNYVGRYSDGYVCVKDKAYLFLQDDDDVRCAVICVRDSNPYVLPSYVDWSVHYARPRDMMILSEERIRLHIPAFEKEQEVLWCTITADIVCEGSFVKKGLFRRKLNVPDDLSMGKRTFEFVEKLWDGVLEKYEFVSEGE